MNNEKIIAFDFQGWPLEKMSFKDILLKLGAVYNLNTNKYEIEKTDKLDTYPVVLEDDGMGYGVNPQYIVEMEAPGEIFNSQIWLSHKDEYIDIYLEDEVQPGMYVMSPGNVWYQVYKYTETNGGEYHLWEVKDVRDNQASIIVCRDKMKEWIKLEKENRGHES